MRHVIRNPRGLLYTGNAIETAYVPHQSDPTRNVERFLLSPEFKTVDVLDALKYDSLADARAVLVHPDLRDPAAFAGCEVCESEFDRNDPQALQPVA